MADIRVNKDIPDWSYACCAGKPGVGQIGSILEAVKAKNGDPYYKVAFPAADLGYEGEETIDLYIPVDCTEPV